MPNTEKFPKNIKLMENEYPRAFYAKNRSSPIIIAIFIWIIVVMLLSWIRIHYMTGFAHLARNPPKGFVQTLLYVLPVLLMIPPGMMWVYLGIIRREKPLLSIFREGLRLHVAVSRNKPVLYSCLFVFGVVLFFLNYDWWIAICIAAFYWMTFQNIYRTVDLPWENLTDIKIRETEGLKIVSSQPGKAPFEFTFSHPDSILEENTFDLPLENVAASLWFYLRDHTSLPSWGEPVS